MNIDHVGYLVEDMEQAVNEFLGMGYEIDFPKYEDAFFNQTVVFMKNTPLRIELISPNSETATVTSLLKKRGAGPYHICYRTDSFDEDFLNLRKRRFMPTMPPTIAETGPLAGEKIAFLMRKDVGIIELVGR